MSYSPKFTGETANIEVTAVGESLINNSGNPIVRAVPVRIDSNGDIQTVDISIEAQALAVAGITKEEVGSGSGGIVVSSGRVENIVTTASNGDILYISKIGGLTNQQPEIGAGGFVAGDFIVRIGILFKNELDPLQQDLMLSIAIVGSL